MGFDSIKIPSSTFILDQGPVYAYIHVDISYGDTI